MPIRRVLESGVPVKVWTDDVEESAQKQLIRTGALPFVFRHVAAMPDTHWGLGATVGSVIATRGAICPAAVGVDIGCFAGDTEVVLSDSRRHKLADLAQVGGEHIVYSCSPTGHVSAAVATARKTRQAAEIVAVDLDNGERIRCTPDHEFMLRDGSYSRADSLSAGDALMPFSVETDRDGYLRVQQNYSGFMQRAHWIIARSGLLGPIPRFDDGMTIIHHRNFDEMDNRPENLEFMSAPAHSAYHRSVIERNEHWQSPEFERRRKEALAAKARTPEGRAYMAERGTRNILAFMKERPSDFRRAVADNGQRGKRYLVRYNKSRAGRAKSSDVAHRIHSCETCGEPRVGGFGIHNHRRYKHGYNHRVLAVRKLAEREDVYCLTVPATSNFALAAGVFVHNCGMAAVKTSLDASALDTKLPALRHSIERSIPVGFHQRKDPHPQAAKFLERSKSALPSVATDAQKKKAALQCGTLGGGNHFIEICVDLDDSKVWVLLHSGSRNIGKVTAEKHIDRAKGLMKKMLVDLPDPDLAYFVQGTDEFTAYVEDLKWCQDFALANRRIMLAEVLRDLRHVVGREDLGLEPEIHCHHNYVAWERHFGSDVMVTRKGAIRARAGELGIIPGSMGTGSFIVRGLGNPEAFESAPHGAGRKMSRGAARRQFTREDLAAQTAGVECRKDAGVIDEIPGAYKPIGEVIQNSSDLVEVVARLKQVVCVKG